METKRKKEMSSGDIANSIVLLENIFHWSTTYNLYLIMDLEERKNDKIWNMALVNVACVPKLFEFKEVVYLYARHFDLNTMTIKIGIKNNPNSSNSQDL